VVWRRTYPSAIEALGAYARAAACTGLWAGEALHAAMEGIEDPGIIEALWQRDNADKGYDPAAIRRAARAALVRLAPPVTALRAAVEALRADPTRDGVGDVLAAADEVAYARDGRDFLNECHYNGPASCAWACAYPGARYSAGGGRALVVMGDDMRTVEVRSIGREPEDTPTSARLRIDAAEGRWVAPWAKPAPRAVPAPPAPREWDYEEARRRGFDCPAPKHGVGPGWDWS